MARTRPPTSRAQTIAWLALGGVLLGLLVGMTLGWVRFSWVDRIAERKREEQQRQREERPAPADPELADVEPAHTTAHESDTLQRVSQGRRFAAQHSEGAVRHPFRREPGPPSETALAENGA